MPNTSYAKAAMLFASVGLFAVPSQAQTYIFQPHAILVYYESKPFNPNCVYDRFIDEFDHLHTVQMCDSNGPDPMQEF